MREDNGGGEQQRRQRQRWQSKWGHNENPKNNVEGNEIVGMVTFTTMVEKKQIREKKKQKAMVKKK